MAIGQVNGPVDRSFVVTPRTAGTHRLTLMATSEVNSPILVFTFVAGADRPFDSGYLLWGLGVALAATGAGVLVRGRRRRRVAASA